MRFFKRCSLLLAPIGISAFQPPALVNIPALKVPTVHPSPAVAKFACVFGLATILSTNPASALSSPKVEVSEVQLSTPSVVVAEVVRELDMSLPSYGEIKSTKASVGNSESLLKPSKEVKAEAPPRRKQGGLPKEKAPPKEKTKKASPDGYTF